MFANISTKVTETVVFLAPAAQAAPAGLADLANTIQDLLISIMTIGFPVLLVAGGLMIGFSGINPQWKKRGMDTIKWAIGGFVFMAVGAGALQVYITSMVP